MSQSVRDLSSCRHLLEALRKAVSFSQGLIVTTLPRGGLQIVQPANVPDAVVKSYSRGVHSEDRPAWRAILAREPVKPRDCWDSRDFEGSVYYRELVEPLGVQYLIVLPLASPVLEGYPGAVYLGRIEQEGDFKSSEVHHLLNVVRQFDERAESSRSSRRAGLIAADSPMHDRPPVFFVIVDSHLHPRLAGAEWSGLDGRLREQMIDYARKRLHHLNGDGIPGDRALFPDSHGDLWNFRVVTYKRYPALGEGAFSFFCLQPGCHEWGGVKPADFQADQELARLIPALKFMQQEFHRGPTLVEISKTVDLSPFHFHRRFTEMLGMTPKQFLLECQIHEAKTQLIAGTKELAAIARDCGFAHQSHFTSRFKQATGLTPTRWRRMMNDRENALATTR